MKTQRKEHAFEFCWAEHWMESGKSSFQTTVCAVVVYITMRFHMFWMFILSSLCNIYIGLHRYMFNIEIHIAGYFVIVYRSYDKGQKRASPRDWKKEDVQERQQGECFC